MNATETRPALSVRHQLEDELSTWRLDLAGIADADLQRMADHVREQFRTRGHARCPVQGHVAKVRIQNERCQSCWRWEAYTTVWVAGPSGFGGSRQHQRAHQYYTRKHEALRSLGTWQARRWASELGPGGSLA
jgi:frataxin-like iron-binding protein CyaY